MTKEKGEEFKDSPRPGIAHPPSYILKLYILIPLLPIRHPLRRPFRRWRNFGPAVLRRHELVTALLILRLQLPRHRVRPAADKLRNQLQGLLDICLWLFKFFLESLKRPVAIFLEAAEYKVEEFVLRDANCFVVLDFLGLRFGDLL